MRFMPTPAALPVRFLLQPVELADGAAELGADAQDEVLSGHARMRSCLGISLVALSKERSQRP